MANKNAGKTIEIIRRSDNKVVNTYYKSFYTKFKGKVYIWKAGVEMEGQKPRGEFNLDKYTWRFK